MRPLLCLALCAATLAGCAAGPDYRRPVLDMPPAFKEAPRDAVAIDGDWQPARPADQQPHGPWWLAYGDPLLSELAGRLQAGNPGIALAEAQLRQARALVDAAQAGAYPALGVAAGATRARNPVAGHAANTLSAALQASWEPDLWGRVHRAVEAAQGGAEASAADLESARLAAQATLVQAYLNLRIADAQQALLQSLVADAERALQLTQHRIDAGVASASDIAQAESLLETTRAQSIDVQAQRAAYEHAIAVLLGEAPARFALAPTSGPRQLAAQLPVVPLGLPADLLQRRPDVAAAERRLAAANANIGVAAAAWFPSLSLGASIGSQAATLAQLFKAPAAVWAWGPSLAATLFDGGARRAQDAQARAEFDAALASYRASALAGMQEVEDALAALRVLAEESVVQQRALAAARRSLALVSNQYRAGTVSYGDVIVAQGNVINAEKATVALLGNRLAASVQLIRALGGGWTTAA